MRRDIRGSTTPKALAGAFPMPNLGESMHEVRLCVERFCLLAGIERAVEDRRPRRGG